MTTSRKRWRTAHRQRADDTWSVTLVSWLTTGWVLVPAAWAYWRERVRLQGGWRRWLWVRLLGGPARVWLALRGRKPFYWGGVYWDACAHRSHRWGLRRWRWFIYDWFCPRHCDTCWGGCDRTEERETT